MRKYILLLLLLPVIIACAQFAMSSGAAGSAEYTDRDIEAISGLPAANGENDVSFPVDLEVQEDLGLYLYRNPITRDRIIAYYTDFTGSREITDIILRYSDFNDLPPSLTFALAFAESGFDPEAVNRNRTSVDKGLFQLNSRSFPWLSDKEFFDPETNARFGIEYLKKCIEKGGNEIVGLAMYNAGARRVTNQGAPRMTLDYIAKIVSLSQEINVDIESSLVEKKVVNRTGKRKKTVKYVLDTGKYSK